MDLTKVSQAERIAGICGALFIVDMWLNWWSGGSILGVSIDFNAWELSDFMDIIWFLSALSGVGLFLMAANNVALNLPVAMSALATGLGGLSTVLIIYRLIDPPYGADRSYGVFVGLILMGAMTYGAFTAMQEEGASLGSGGGGGGSGRTPPPPPPPPPPQAPPRA
jgi:hypothetical protein